MIQTGIIDGSGDVIDASDFTTTDDEPDEPTITSTSSVGSGLLGSDGVVLGDDSYYDPSGGDPTDASTGTVTTDTGQTETIDLGTDRGQAVINSSVVDPESDDVTGSGTNPDGVQRVYDPSAPVENATQAAENALSRWSERFGSDGKTLALVGAGGLAVAALAGSR